MATAHRRALGTLLIVVVQLAACMPAARPETLASVVAPAAPSTATEEDISALIGQLCDDDWIAADRASAALVSMGEAAATSLVTALSGQDGSQCGAMMLRALAAMPEVAASALKDQLLQESDFSYQGLYTLALVQMGTPGLAAIRDIAENSTTGSDYKLVALGAMPLLGPASRERLAAMAPPPATAEERRVILTGLLWLGEEALDEQKSVFALMPSTEQEAYLSWGLPVGQLDRQAAPLLAAVVSDQVSSEAVTDTVKLAAINILSSTLVEPASAAPALMAAAGSGSLSPTLRTAAIDALGRYGPAAHSELDALRALLNQKDQQHLAPALVLAIGRIGEGEPDILKELLAAGAACDMPDRAAAAVSVARALSGMGLLSQFSQDETEKPLQDRVLAVLNAMLMKCDEDVKLAAIEALGQQGAHALPALYGAIKTANTPERQQRLSEAFAAVGADAVPGLISQLVSPYATRSAQRIAQGAIKLIGAPALPAIVQAWHTGSNRPSRGRLLTTLYAIGPDAFAVLLDLARQDGITLDRQQLETTFSTVTATEAGDLISPALAAPAALPVLIGAASPLTTATTDNKQAVILIGFIGPPAAPAVPALAALLRSQDDVQLQCRIAEALQHIGPDAGIAAPALADALARHDPTPCELGPDGSTVYPHQEQMIYALAALRSQAAPAVPELIRALAMPELRRPAADALGAAGAAAHAPLLRLLRTPNGDSDLRRAAAYALRQSSAKLDPVTAMALGELAQAAGEDPYVAAMLAAALTAHGYPVPEALLARGVAGLSSRMCPSWPALADSGVVAFAYDPYLDACPWDFMTAPTWQEVVDWLGSVFH